MKIYFACFVLIFIVSCRSQPDSNQVYDKYDAEKTYKLQLNPAPGSAYYYDIVNESEINFTVNDQEIKNINRSNVGINYKIAKDSAGNLLLTTQFDKIHLYSKNKNGEKEMDAGNAALSADPIEKMLGILKETNIVATVSVTGETKNITGYKEIGEKIIAAFPATDETTKMAIESQWEKTIGQSLIKKNFDQLFKIFPDSAVHLGDIWKLSTKQEGELIMLVESTYKLKAINSEIAIVESNATITNENSLVNLPGIGGNTVPNLKGEQQGEFEIEAKTGMLISSRIKATIVGTLRVMGREVPLKITSTVKMNGKKLK